MMSNSRVPRIVVLISLRRLVIIWISVKTLKNITKHHIHVIDLGLAEACPNRIPHEVVHLSFVDLLSETHDRHVQRVFRMNAVSAHVHFRAVAARVNAVVLNMDFPQIFAYFIQLWDIPDSGVFRSAWRTLNRVV